MTDRYNPNNPAVVGTEWFGAATSSKKPALTSSATTTIVSTVTESVDQIIPWVDPDPASHGGLLGCDIYDLATLPTGWPQADLPDTRRSIKPVANSGAAVAGGGAWNKNTGGVLTGEDSTNWQQLDDGISDADPPTTGQNDSMQYNIVNSTGARLSFKGGNTFADGATGTSTADLTGLRIAGIEVVVTYKAQIFGTASINGFLTVDGNDYMGTAIQTNIASAIAPIRVGFLFSYDPRSGLPWTNAAAQTFVATATNFFGFFIKGTPGTGVIQITECGLMFHTVPERRIAIAENDTSPSSGWLTLQCQNVNDGTTAAWSKLDGHSYLLAFHLSHTPGNAATIPTIDTSTVAGHENDPALFVGNRLNNESGAIPISYFGADLTNLAVLLGSTPSVDSQPYTTTRYDGIGGPTDQKLRQGFTTEDTEAYGTATVVVQTTSSGTPNTAAQDQPLSITLHLTATDAILAGPFLLDPIYVPPDGKWHVVTVRFPISAALSAAEPIYLELSSTGSTNPWYAAALLTRTPPITNTDPMSVAAAAVSISGTTSGSINGVADITLDYPWNIGTVPSPPTGATSAVATIANQPALTGTGIVPTIAYAAITWDATSLGTAFGYYELLRFEAAVDNFMPVAKITLESSAYFNDFEVTRNSAMVPVYLVRVVRADGQPSDFVLVTNTIDIMPTSGPCDLVLTSNYAPELSLAFQDETPYEFSRAETPATVIQRIAGRPFPVQFQANGEGQGDIFARNLIIATNDPSVTGETSDRTVFDPLVALCDAAVPYVCVTNGAGRRWLCGLTFGKGTRTEPGGDYTAAVTFNEVSNVPVPLTIDIPWPPGNALGGYHDGYVGGYA